MRTHLLTGLFMIVNLICAQENNNLIDTFQESDWVIVSEVKEKIENDEARYLPDLIALLDKNTEVKLTNTGDLIYPGAPKFYGHGKIIDYNIDNLSIRAGWLIEEITFKNFGFSGIHNHPSKLPSFIKNNFPEYYHKNVTNIENMNEEQLRRVVLNESIIKAKKWWEANNKNWTRLTSLEQALNSDDNVEQVQALSYLRNGTTRCTGLTNEFYRTNLYPTINTLKVSHIKRISEQANLILDDTSLSWLKMKPTE